MPPLPPGPLINPPNTPQGHLPLRWDQLPYQQPSTEADRSRASDESSHYTYQRLQYCHEVCEFPATSDGHISLPPNFSPDTKAPQGFCWKSCAVYIAVNPDLLGRPTFKDLFHAIYRLWFKGDATNVQFGNFFAKCIRCWPEDRRIDFHHVFRADRYTEVDIPALIATHRALCAKIKACIAESGSESKVVFVPLFEKVLIVMDTVNWDWEGLQIVRSDQARPLRLDCNNFDIPQPTFREGDQGQVFRARLEDVVRLVESMRIREDEGRMWPQLAGKDYTAWKNAVPTFHGRNQSQKLIDKFTNYKNVLFKFLYGYEEMFQGMG